MLQSIRAVYKDGQLHPLEPLDLPDGQTVNITILAEDVTMTIEEMDLRLRTAGLLAGTEVEEAVEELTPEERLRIGKRFIGDRPSEALIDEERGLY